MSKGITRDELEKSLESVAERKLLAIVDKHIQGAFATNRNKRDLVKELAEYISDEIKWAEMEGMF